VELQRKANQQMPSGCKTKAPKGHFSVSFAQDVPEQIAAFAPTLKTRMRRATLLSTVG
jgi:hypothetical protein